MLSDNPDDYPAILADLVDPVVTSPSNTNSSKKHEPTVSSKEEPHPLELSTPSSQQSQIVVTTFMNSSNTDEQRIALTFRCLEATFGEIINAQSVFNKLSAPLQEQLRNTSWQMDIAAVIAVDEWLNSFISGVIAAMFKLHQPVDEGSLNERYVFNFWRRFTELYNAPQLPDLVSEKYNYDSLVALPSLYKYDEATSYKALALIAIKQKEKKDVSRHFLKAYHLTKMFSNDMLLSKMQEYYNEQAIKSIATPSGLCVLRQILACKLDFIADKISNRMLHESEEAPHVTPTLADVENVLNNLPEYTYSTPIKNMQKYTTPIDKANKIKSTLTRMIKL